MLERLIENYNNFAFIYNLPFGNTEIKRERERDVCLELLNKTYWSYSFEATCFYIGHFLSLSFLASTT